MTLKNILSLFFLNLTIFSVSAQETGVVKNLGPQLHTANVQGSTFITSKEGKQYLYTAVRGRPAHLIGFDLESNQLIADLPIAGNGGAWTLAPSSDGYIYVGSAQGELFKHRPGTQVIEDLGKFQGEKLIWDMVPGLNGEIYGGTWPNAKAFKYHPDQGFIDLTNGSAGPEKQYSRFVAYNPRTSKLYAAVFFDADVIEINTITGEKKSLFSPHYKEKGAFYNLNLIHTKEGDKLLVWLNNKGVGRETLVYDLKTLTVEKTLPSLEVRFIQQNKNTTYFTVDGKLYNGDLTTESIKAAKMLATFPGKVLASRWKSKTELQYFTADGSLSTYNIKRKKTTSLKLGIPPQPIDIQSVFNGPDGKIWMGGYLAGGHAYYDPKNGKTTEFHGLHQTEGMAKLGTDLFFGIYPGGKIYKLDTRKPFDLSKGNPKHLISIKDQSRPFTNLTVGNKILFGTIPEYGALGGAITEYDSVTERFKTYEVIKNQSPTALVEINGKVWGGTSISGGLGIAPTEKEARLFSWNMETNKVDFETVPFPGNISITALTNGPDENLWGYSDGYIFTYNIKQNKVVFQYKVDNFERNRTHIWIDGKLILHPNGLIYGTGGNKFFSIDPATKNVKIIHEGVGLLAMDNNGILYFRKKADLYSYQPLM